MFVSPIAARKFVAAVCRISGAAPKSHYVFSTHSQSIILVTSISVFMKRDMGVRIGKNELCAEKNEKKCILKTSNRVFKINKH